MWKSSVLHPIVWGGEKKKDDAAMADGPSPAESNFSFTKSMFLFFFSGEKKYPSHDEFSAECDDDHEEEASLPLGPIFEFGLQEEKIE